MGISLVTGGCSFTAYVGTWPHWLIKEIEKSTKERPLRLHNTGLGASSNEVIARRTIHQVNSLLKDGITADDIFVSVMWSGANRVSFYSDEKLSLQGMFGLDDPLDEALYTHSKPGTADRNPPVPFKWPKNDNIGRYYHVTPGITESPEYNPLAVKWYKHFHNDNISIAKSYEHVLRVQWYLNNLNINYIMQTYATDWDSEYHSKRNKDQIKSHIQIEYLREMIDWSKFTDVSCYQWVKDNSKLSWTAYDPIRDLTRAPGDQHPTSQQMQEYTTNYLWPLIKKRIKDGKLL